MIVAELNEGSWPCYPSNFAQLDDFAQKDAMECERSLLYVAMTRAMKHVLLIGVGDAPRELSEPLK